MSAEYEDGGWDHNRGYGRGRGRGRGRNFRGRGRGGYNGPLVDTLEDTGGYNQEAPPQGRGTQLFLVPESVCSCGNFWHLFGFNLVNCLSSLTSIGLYMFGDIK